MIVTQLRLANLRAIETAGFSFRPGVNLIVGVNGVGKSTVLDALRICMSRVLPSITASRAKAMSFGVDDIRNGLPFLDIGLTFELGGREFRFTRLQWREKVATDDAANLDRLRREILETERLRDRARNLLRELDDSQGVSDSDSFAPPKADLRRAAKGLPAPPMCIFFSTSRSVIGGKTAPKERALGDAAAAYAEALSARSWQVSQFADWMRVQTVLAHERPVASRHLEALQLAASR